MLALANFRRKIHLFGDNISVDWLSKTAQFLGTEGADKRVHPLINTYIGSNSLIGAVNLALPIKITIVVSLHGKYARI